MQKLFRSLIAVGGLAGLVACGDDVSVTAPPTPDLAVSGAPVTAVQVGATIQLSANQAVTWSSSNAAVASVDGNGLVTAAGAGTASITATSTADVSKKASVTITVVAPAVRSVVVSPNAVTMNPGGTQGFVANVDADAGVARTVTWSSSNTAAVTITAAGVATAVAPGVATITAASTVSPSVVGAASVTVRQPTAARVSIQKVTVAGNLNNPVNLNAVAGQVDVTIDVDPGDFIVTEVNLLVDGQVVGTQTFTAEQSRELTNAHAFADLANAVASTVISWNSAAFNPTTGAVLPINQNGPKNLSATIKTQGSTTGNQASTTLNIVLANVSGWITSFTNTGTNTGFPSSATNPTTGTLWHQGSVTLNLLGINYVPGVSFDHVSGTMWGAGGPGCTMRTFSNLTPAAGTQSFSVTFPNSGTGSLNVVGCTSPPTGDTPNVTGAVLTNGQAGSTLILNGTLPPPTLPPVTIIRLDNAGPSLTTGAAPIGFSQNTNVTNGVGGWIAGTTVFANTTNQSPSTGWAVTDPGVSGVTRTFFWGAAATAPSPCSGSSSQSCIAGLTEVASGADIQPGPTSDLLNNLHVVRALWRDALGNPRTDNMVGPFGVDVVPPTQTFAATDVSVTNPNLIINAALPTGQFVLSYVDDASGFTATPVRMAITILGATGTSAAPVPLASNQVCLFGDVSSQNVCNVVLNGGTVDIPTLLANPAGFPGNTDPTTPAGAQGYLTISAFTRDQGGLASATLTETALYDVLAPIHGGIGIPATLTGGTAASLAGSASDNVDLLSAQWWLSSPLSGFIRQGTATTLGTAFDATLTTAANFNYTTTNFMRSVAQTDAGHAPQSNAQLSDQVRGRVSDAAGNTGDNVQAISPINISQVTPLTAWAGITGFTTWQGFTSQANVSNPACTNPVAAVNPTSTTLTAVATFTNLTANFPFSSVNFYIPDADGLTPIGVGAVSVSTSLTNRTFTYTLAWDPACSVPAGVTNLVAIGVNTAGDALMTQVIPVTITVP